MSYLLLDKHLKPEWEITMSAKRILSREEERDLAIRWKKNGDVAARNRLVLLCDWVVPRIIKEKIRVDYKSAAYKDLLQEGRLGLFEAADRFDPNENVWFSSYAVWWVRAYVMKAFYGNTKETKAFLEAVSLDKHVFKSEDDRRRTSHNSVSDPQSSPDHILGLDNPVDERLMRQVVASSLYGFERSLIELRYLNDNQTLEQIGNKFGVSRERVRQVEALLLKKLKGCIENWQDRVKMARLRRIYGVPA